jgi:hypothetical protein
MIPFFRPRETRAAAFKGEAGVEAVCRLARPAGS